MTKTILLTIMALLPLTVCSEVVCKSKSLLGNSVEVRVGLFESPTLHGTQFAETPSASISVTDANGNLVYRRDLQSLSSEYDGHESGLITGPGFSFKYSDDYGCIRNVVVTADTRGGAHGAGFIETMNIPLCTGGTTQDAFCR